MLKDVRHLAYLGLATTSLAGAVVAVAMTAMAADDSNNKDRDNNRNAPVSLLSVIQVPGNPGHQCGHFLGRSSDREILFCG
jgi:hypothetical protein